MSLMPLGRRTDLAIESISAWSSFCSSCGGGVWGGVGCGAVWGAGGVGVGIGGDGVEMGRKSGGLVRDADSERM